MEMLKTSTYLFHIEANKILVFRLLLNPVLSNLTYY